MVRAKVTCIRNEQVQGDEEGLHNVEFIPVYGDGKTENAQYWKYTPSGSIHLNILNEAAHSQFQVGKEYYVDFTPADQE